MTVASTAPIHDRWKLQVSHLAEILIFGMSFNLLIIVENREYFSPGVLGVKVMCSL